MRPCNQLGEQEAKRLRGVLFDLDDTVLSDGELSPAALTALYALRDSGLELVGVTGRPASWGQVLLRQWPLVGMITENGNVSLSKSGRRVVYHDRLAPSERRSRRRQLADVVATLSAEFPELAVTDDSLGRWADVSLDVNESVSLDPALVQRAAAYALSLGVRIVLSSVHLHLQLDVDDKATGALRFLSQQLGVDATAARFDYAFIGDSGNDAPCFAAFQTTIGVSNLQGALTLLPRYVTQRARGPGFVEFCSILLERRGTPIVPSAYAITSVRG